MKITKITYGLEVRVENPLKYEHPDAKFDSMKPFVSMEATLDENGDPDIAWKGLQRLVRDKIKQEELDCQNRMAARTRALLQPTPQAVNPAPNG